MPPYGHEPPKDGPSLPPKGGDIASPELPWQETVRMLAEEIEALKRQNDERVRDIEALQERIQRGDQRHHELLESQSILSQDMSDYFRLLQDLIIQRTPAPPIIPLSAEEQIDAAAAANATIEQLEIRTTLEQIEAFLAREAHLSNATSVGFRAAINMRAVESVGGPGNRVTEAVFLDQKVAAVKFLLSTAATDNSILSLLLNDDEALQVLVNKRIQASASAAAHRPVQFNQLSSYGGMQRLLGFAMALSV